MVEETSVPKLIVAYDEGSPSDDFETMLLIEEWPDGVLVVLEEFFVRHTESEKP